MTTLPNKRSVSPRIRDPLVGVGVWLIAGVTALAGALPIGWIEWLLILAPLVVVPLGLDLVADGDHFSARSNALRWILRLRLPAALLVVTSFALPKGLAAAALASSWMLVTALIALFGARRWFAHRDWSGASLTLTAALVYLPIGGGWLVISRLGFRPLDFPEVIVLLTAVHFHYAAFVTPLLAATIARHVRRKHPLLRRAATATCIAVVVGPPLLAVGITMSPLLEIVAAGLLAVGLLLLAGLNATYVLDDAAPLLPRTLLAISTAAVVLSTLFACAYAAGEFRGEPLVDIPTMAAVHGTANAVGFGLCGLVGWKVARRR